MSTKKEFRFQSEGRLFRIKWEGGGEIPQVLSGLYTSFHEAKNAANAYLEKKNAKNNSRKK